MNQLKIKITGNIKNIYATCDDQAVKLKTNKFDALEGNCSTDKTQVELKVFNVLEIKSKLWWLWQILYFVVSIFGIFDIKMDKYCVIINCKVKIDITNSNEITIAIPKAKDQNQPNIYCKNEYEIIENTTSIDAVAKKRVKIVKILKAIAWIALIIGVVAIIVSKLV